MKAPICYIRTIVVGLTPDCRLITKPPLHHCLAGKEYSTSHAAEQLWNKRCADESEDDLPVLETSVFSDMDNENRSQNQNHNHNNNHNPPSLVSLPSEIQLSIISHLSLYSIQVLRCTNQHFRGLIASPAITTLLQAEDGRQAVAREAYACAVCLCLRNARYFSDAFRMGVFSKKSSAFWRIAGVSGADLREKRFCIECGTANANGVAPRYRRGDTWTRFGVPYVKCRECLQVKKGERERRYSPLCPECYH